MDEKRIYTHRQSRPESLPMSKQINDTLNGFGPRLTQLRKAADYTQQQLADEVGVSRRMIAYYEGETGHPPTSFLVNLAQALAISTDALLGNQPMKKATAKTMLSTRWERRVRQIERLSAKPKQQIVTFIDAILVAEQARLGDKP
jgi:transcriptional regulator with XRE-family HTH domain